MPARIVIVHDEPDFADSLTTALRSAGHDVATFMDPQVGWNALDKAHRVELLITRVAFPPGKPNGVSLARMARYKRVLGHSSEANHPARAAPAADFHKVVLRRENLGGKGKLAIERRFLHDEDVEGTRT
jgi:CheY-like chemotaxis protein